jgi:hypothetical protein
MALNYKRLLFIAQGLYSMLVEEYNLNILSLSNRRCLQAEVFQIPVPNKHKQR